MSAQPALPPYAPSPNLAAVERKLEGQAGQKWLKLARLMEAGETLTDEQEVDVYDALLDLVYMVFDLADMCRRREEGAYELGGWFGPPNATSPAKATGEASS
ncbi:MAG: hypothetical protein Q7T61_01115 [Caulobacter sp.]|nr:hypothetical protein [Caulobacter sp.]